MATNTLNQIRIPLSFHRGDDGLPTLIRRNLESLLSLEDAALVLAGIDKARHEESRMIELSEKSRRLFWKGQHALASSDRDGSEDAALWLEKHPLKSEYAAAGRQAKTTARHRRALALRGIAAEVATFQGKIAEVLSATAATLAEGHERLSLATGIEVMVPAEIEELRIQAAEHRELARTAAAPSTWKIAQSFGGLDAIAAARIAMEGEKAEPAITKARKRVAAIDEQPVPEAVETEAEAEAEDPQLALS
jgi:hypothetical protein